MIEHQQERYSWQFLFLGANQDAFAEANRLGFESAMVAQFDASAEGLLYAIGSTSKAVRQYRKEARLGSEWKEEEIDELRKGSLVEAGSGKLEAGAMSDHLKPIVEALIFASPVPLTPKVLYKLLDSEPKEDIDAALAALLVEYDGRQSGLQMVQVAGGFQIVTKPELNECVRCAP